MGIRLKKSSFSTLDAYPTNRIASMNANASSWRTVHWACFHVVWASTNVLSVSWTQHTVAAVPSALWNAVSTLHFSHLKLGLSQRCCAPKLAPAEWFKSCTVLTSFHYCQLLNAFLPMSDDDAGTSFQNRSLRADQICHNRIANLPAVSALSLLQILKISSPKLLLNHVVEPT